MNKKLIFLAIILGLVVTGIFTVANAHACGSYSCGSYDYNCGCSHPTPPPPPPPPPVLHVSCDANTSYAQTGTPVTWTSNASGGIGNYTFSWTGSDGLSGAGSQISHSYGSAGQQTATVAVTSGTQHMSATCVTTTYTPYVPPAPPVYNPPVYNPPVYNPPVYNPPVYLPPVYTAPVYVTPPVQPVVLAQSYPLTVSCQANPVNAYPGSVVTWTAFVSGGDYNSYNYNNYNGNNSLVWTGTDGLSAFGNTVSKVYVTEGQKVATVTVYRNGQTVTASCASFVYAAAPTPTSRVYLNRVPYTGEGDALKVGIFLSILAAWSALVAWIILKRRQARLAGVMVAASTPVAGEPTQSGNFLDMYLAKLRGQANQ